MRLWLTCQIDVCGRRKVGWIRNAGKTRDGQIDCVKYHQTRFTTPSPPPATLHLPDHHRFDLYHTLAANELLTFILICLLLLTADLSLAVSLSSHV